MNESPSEQRSPELPDARLLAILACPACHGVIVLENGGLACKGCGRRFPIVDGIPVMLVGAEEDGSP